MSQLAELVRKWATNTPPTRAIEQSRDSTTTKPRNIDTKRRLDDLEQRRQLRQLIGQDPY